MTFEPTDHGWAQTDVAELLGDGTTPEHRPDFWHHIDTELTRGGLAVDDRTDDRTDNRTDNVVPLTAAGDRSTDEERGGSRWLLAGAAALIAILGLGSYLLASATTDENRVFAGDGGTGTDGYASLPQPVDADGQPIENPLVDFMRLSTSNADDLLFTMEADPPLRTRIAVLDRFVGPSAEMWTTDGAFLPLDGVLPPPGLVDENRSPSAAAFRATITMRSESDALASRLPVPAHIAFIEALDDGELSFDARSRLVLSASNDPTRHYELLATGQDVGLPGPAARPEGFGAALQPYLELPDSVRRSLAGEVASLQLDGIPAVDQARRLEDRFRQIQPIPIAIVGLDVTDTENGVLSMNNGTPSRIAGTFALAARALDIPSRVVVGFDTGERLGGRDDLWFVHGRNATVSVELFVDDRWQMFDPVAGRVQLAGPPPADTADATPPVMNRDHWFAIFAMYDCTTDSYLPPLMSDVDEVGIHSHQDGLIHVHPWFDVSAGENATLDVFFETMDVEISDGRIVAAGDGIDISATESCPDGSVVHLRKWRFDFEVENTKPQVVSANIGDVRFMNDREVYVLALAPVDAELPPIPESLFATLNELTAPDPLLSTSPESPTGEIAVPEEVGTWFYHDAVDGDTLESLAAQFDVDIDILRNVNLDIVEPLAGQRVVIVQRE